jgi:hypothetical protein
VKLIVDWFPTIWLTVTAVAICRLQWYYYDRTKTNRTDWLGFKMVKFYIEETKKEYGRIGFSFWILLTTPVFAFISMILRVFYYKHM